MSTTTHKLILADFPSEWVTVELYPLNDLHIGDQYTDIALFRRFKKHILEADNRFVICLGDLMNNAVKSSVSNVYNESISPRDQKKWVIAELEELKDRILLMIGGNHEERTLRDSDADLTEDIADAIGAYGAYRSNEAVLKVTVGKGINGKKICYLIYCTHGTGGGKRPGGKLNNITDLARGIDCDIYVVGHYHTKIAHKDVFRRVDMQNNIISDEQERLFVVASSYTSFGGYAARGMMIPSSKGTVPIIMSGREKFFTATV